MTTGRSRGTNHASVSRADDPVAVAINLNEISSAIRGETLDEVLSSLTDHLVRLPLVRAAGVWLMTPQRTAFQTRIWTTRDEQPAVPHEVGVDDSLIGQVALSQSPEQHDGSWVVHELFPPGTKPPHALDYFAGVPLWYRSTTLGTLGLFADRRLAEPEMAALSALGERVSAEIVIQAGDRQLTQFPAANTNGDNTSTLMNFVGTVAHELRSPLTGLRGNIQLAAMSIRKGNYDRLEKRLESALRAVDSMAALVQNLQDMSRLERGIFRPNPTTADLRTSVWNAMARLEQTVAMPRHTVEVSAPDPVICVHDPQHLEQAVYNVMLNALQYWPDGGTIVVRVERQGDTGLVSVRDEGIGIAPEDQHRIFEPYYRSVSARQIHAKGLGIGLAISRATVERHGGRLLIQSQPGIGSTFTIQLPLMSDAAAAD